MVWPYDSRSNSIPFPIPFKCNLDMIFTAGGFWGCTFLLGSESLSVSQVGQLQERIQNIINRLRPSG